jgi:pyruvate dehydrogenase E1 component alpha subunit
MEHMTDDLMIQVMNADGSAEEEAVKEIPDQLMMRMYRLMTFTRLWNSKALSLQRQGRMGTLASVRGQEASNVGTALALEPADWFCPSFREHGAQLVRGMKPADLYLYWAGDERGMKPPEGVGMLPTCITVGSHLCHAVGIAMGAKIRGDRIAVLSSSGDGSTSQGDFHEALNFAAVYQLPVVFVIQNNHWAISVPVHKQTATRTLAEKAAAYGLDGLRVDGNDVAAVYLTVKKRLNLARENHVPALIELVTYRMDDHTTADDASRYRTEEMTNPWKLRDPIDRLRKYLTARKGWSDADESRLQAECAEEVEKAVRDFEATPPPHPSRIFDYTFAEDPRHIKEQRQDLANRLGEGAR